MYICTYSLCSDLAGSCKYTKPCKKKKLSDACETPEIKGPPKPWA